MMFSTEFLDQHRALIEYSHLAGDHPDELHVVFYHDERLAAADFAHQFRGLQHLLLSHPGRRFVEQDERRLGRKHDAEFDPLPLTMRELANCPPCRGRETDALQHFVDHRQCASFGMNAARRKPNILPHAQPVEYAGHLGLDADAEARDLMRLSPGDIASAEQHHALARLQLARQHLEEGAFAGAIGTDEAA